MPVVAASTPGGCFDAAIEAARIALKYRTPVYLLSDAYLANGSEPWLLPDVDALPDITVEFATEPNRDGEFLPYLRDPRDARAAVGDPGHAGPRAPDRRAREGRTRPATSPTTPTTTTAWFGCARRRSPGIAADIPELEVDDPDGARLLVLGWGGTYGPITAAVRRLRKDGEQGRARAPDAT